MPSSNDDAFPKWMNHESRKSQNVLLKKLGRRHKEKQEFQEILFYHDH